MIHRASGVLTTGPEGEREREREREMRVKET